VVRAKSILSERARPGAQVPHPVAPPRRQPNTTNRILLGLLQTPRGDRPDTSPGPTPPGITPAARLGRSFQSMSGRCTLPLMTRDNWWLAVKIFLGLPLLMYAMLSVLEPQREIWRKPTKKVLVAFIIAWSAVLCFIALALVWNAFR
jgi:hypothetical protein